MSDRSGGGSLQRLVNVGVTALRGRDSKYFSTRWIGVLDTIGFSELARRGRVYARRRKVGHLEFHPGLVKAQADTGAAIPFDIRIEWTTWSKSQWDELFDAISRQAVFSADLLAGELTESLEQAIETSVGPLWPASEEEMTFSCNCGEPGQCRHIAAAVHLIGLSLDDDPLLLLELRGRKREEILTALRARRADQQEEVAEETPPATVIESADPIAFWRSKPDLDAVEPKIEPPDAPYELLKALGQSPFPPGRFPVIGLLATVYEKVGRCALEQCEKAKSAAHSATDAD